jgi:AraC-like DNA-binding protein
MPTQTPPPSDPQPQASGAFRIDFTYRSLGPIDAIFHSHNAYEIYYFHEGVCTYLIGDRIYTLQPGDLILMNGMTLHCAKIDRRFDYIRTIIHFDPAAVQAFLDFNPELNVLEPFQQLGNLRLTLAGHDRELVERMLADMQALQKGTDAVSRGRFRLKFLDLLYVVYEMCRKPLEDRDSVSTAKEKAVQKVITYLEEHYAEDLHLEELQENLHASKYYLSKLFKDVTGVTIFDFLYQRRINQAKIEFVLDPAVTVTEVCFRVGFKHLAHFSRMFKRQVGVTPEQFKKRLITP